MIPVGNYKAKGVEGALGRTSSGKEQLAVLLEIISGDFAGEQFTWYAHFSDKTIERDFESLRHLGWVGDDLTDLTGIDANEVSIKIEHEEGTDGKVRPRVRWINANGAGLAMKDRMDAQAARAFAARMRTAAAASRARGGAPQQRTQQVPRRQTQDEPSPFGGDDIPF